MVCLQYCFFVRNRPTWVTFMGSIAFATRIISSVISVHLLVGSYIRTNSLPTMELTYGVLESIPRATHIRLGSYF